jgi:hypothetical protein
MSWLILQQMLQNSRLERTIKLASGSLLIEIEMKKYHIDS